MRIVTETSLENFEAWSGAVDTLNTLNKKGLTEQLESILEVDIFPDGCTDTELNDLLWFENDAIAEWLGFSSWEALENDGKEEEEDEYTEEEAKAILFESIGNGETFKSFCGNFGSCNCCPFNHECADMHECEIKYDRMMEEYEEAQEEE